MKGSRGVVRAPCFWLSPQHQLVNMKLSPFRFIFEALLLATAYVCTVSLVAVLLTLISLRRLACSLGPTRTSEYDDVCSTRHTLFTHYI